MTMERRESITESRSKALPESAPGFSGATCSVLSEARGRTTVERLVGRRATVSHARLRADAPRAGAPFKMAGVRSFASSPTAFTPLWSRPAAAAGGRDVRLGGGVATIRQYLRAGLIDELHLAIRPVLLGSGEHLLEWHRYACFGL